MTGDRDRCVNYNVGHHLHWIQAKLARRSPARLGRATAEGDGWVRLELDDGEELRRWCHDGDRLRELLATGGGRVQLRSHGVLSEATGSGSAVSVAMESSPCVAPDQVRDDASLVDLIAQVGGFTVGGPAAGGVDEGGRDRRRGLAP
ncbi:MAG: hypothetical protein QOG43_1223 [Actinomycetota bacterium]|jgi:hypothetical protein|nr:hypothetical protein [Actinomycetota bacterium]